MSELNTQIESLMVNESKTYLIVDTPYLCWRAYHSLRGLQFEGQPTDCLFGIFRDILTLQDQHATKDIIFCFDQKPYERQKVYPDYKKGLVDFTDEDVEKFNEVRRQLKQLRTELLPDLGYRNIFSQKGFESDDLIASIIQNTLRKQDFAIIISSDKDLYQLLSNQVMIWNPDTRRRKDPGVSPSTLMAKYGITPQQWVEVKAIAGCISDNIKGVDKVGEITACKYLTKQLNPKHKAYWNILNSQEIIRRNLQLVTLPWPGVEIFELQSDETNSKKWREVCKRLGFKSLLGRF